MEQEYTLSIFSKFFYGLAAVAMLGFALFLLYKSSEQYSDSQPAANFVFEAILTAVAAILISYTIRRQVTVSKLKITVRGMFDKRELPAENIKGFRVDEKSIFVETVNWNYKRLRINDYSSLRDSIEMIETLNAYFIDLDAVERQEELNVLLDDNTLGYSKEERMENVGKAKKIALIYNVCGCILFLGVFLKDYAFVICVITFIYPLIGIYLIISSKGLIKFFTLKNNPLPSIYGGMYVPSILLMIITIVDYHIVDRNQIWIPFLLISAVIMVLISLKGLTTKGNAGQFFCLLFISLAYGNGCALMINCGFDNSAPKTFTAIIHNKYKTKDVPYIKIGDWGTYKESGEIKVNNGLYNRMLIGSTVKVEMKKGLLNVPWYYVDL